MLILLIFFNQIDSLLIDSHFEASLFLTDVCLISFLFIFEVNRASPFIMKFSELIDYNYEEELPSYITFNIF